MKKIVTAVSAIALTIGLSACGAQTDPTSVPTPASQSDSSLNDGEFADLVRDNTSVTGTDAEFANLAKMVCESLDTTEDVYVEVGTLVDAGFTNEDAAFFVGASIGAYCDEHAVLIENM